MNRSEKASIREGVPPNAKVHYYTEPPWGAPVCGTERWYICTNKKEAVTCGRCKGMDEMTNTTMAVTAEEMREDVCAYFRNEVERLKKSQAAMPAKTNCDKRIEHIQLRTAEIHLRFFEELVLTGGGN